jgi:hypothetical protein
MTTDKQIWGQRGNNSPAINGKQQSTNAQHAQWQTSNNGRMRWRRMGGWWLKRRGGWSNGQATKVGGVGVTTVLTTTTTTTKTKTKKNK